MDIGGYGEFSAEKIRIWMDMDPAERGGVEWVSEFCPVKGSSFAHATHAATPGALLAGILYRVLAGCDTSSAGNGARDWPGTDSVV